MRSDYFNSEHYHDETAGRALENIEREARKGMNCSVNSRSQSFTHRPKPRHRAGKRHKKKGGPR